MLKVEDWAEIRSFIGRRVWFREIVRRRVPGRAGKADRADLACPGDPSPRLDDLIVLDRAGDGTTVVIQAEGPVAYPAAI
ncbi:MAG: hypothetical protein ACRDIF_07860 [Actinomycetota bacterium]